MKKLRGCLIALLVAMVVGVYMPNTAYADTQSDSLVSHALTHVGDKYNTFGDESAFTTDWCAMFIEHCSKKAGLSAIIPTSGYACVNDIAYNIVNKKGGKITFVDKSFYDAKKGNFTGTKVYNASYAPRKGDLIIFGSDATYWQHIGIVRSNCSKPKTDVLTVEGNTGSSSYKTSVVAKKTRASVSGFNIVAYVTPKYANVTQHALHFTDSNQSTVLKSDIIVGDGESFTLPSATKTGYVLSGWNVRRLLDGTYYHSDGSGWTTATTNLRLYAPGSTFTLGPAWTTGCTKSNYRFFAKWAPIKWTVKYNANGGTGTMASTTHTYAAKTPLRANSFKRDGYNFAGWGVYRASDGKRVYTNGTNTGWYKPGAQPSGYTLYLYKDGCALPNLTSVNNDTLTMYASWKVHATHTYTGFTTQKPSGSWATSTNVISKYPKKTMSVGETCYVSVQTDGYYKVKSYDFQIKAPGKTTYTSVGKYSTTDQSKKVLSAAYTWKPNTSGSYTFRVVQTLWDGTQSTYTTGTMNVEAADEPEPVDPEPGVDPVDPEPGVDPVDPEPVDPDPGVDPDPIEGGEGAQIGDPNAVVVLPIFVELEEDIFTYNGEVHHPNVIVKDANGAPVHSSKYTVDYPDGCKNVGEYTIYVTPKMDKSEVYDLGFLVLPKATTIKKLTKSKKAFTVKWGKRTTQVTGYQIRYSTKSSMKNAKTKTIKSNKTTSKKIKKLKKKKKYYVQVRTYKTVNGEKYYSKWSAKKSVKTK